MVFLHFALAGILFVFGLLMRFGLAGSLVSFGYRHIPKYKRVAFDEFDVRYFMGETAIKLGVILLMIAIVSLADPAKQTQATVIGWTCFIIYAALSVTLIDKLDIFEKRRREKRKERYEKALTRYTPYSGREETDSGDAATFEKPSHNDRSTDGKEPDDRDGSNGSNDNERTN